MGGVYGAGAGAGAGAGVCTGAGGAAGFFWAGLALATGAFFAIRGGGGFLGGFLGPRLWDGGFLGGRFFGGHFFLRATLALGAFFFFATFLSPALALDIFTPLDFFAVLDFFLAMQMPR